MDRSTAGRIAPTRLDINPILYDAWNDHIAAGKFKHFAPSHAIVLRIILDELNTICVVMITSFLAIGTTGLRINKQRHFRNPLLVCKIVYQMRLNLRN